MAVQGEFVYLSPLIELNKKDEKIIRQQPLLHEWIADEEGG